MSGRVLGVDVGTVRVGLAVSSGVVATPLTTIDGLQAPQLAVRLAQIAREQDCETVVVGLPRALSGRDTASTTAAREVVAALQALGVHTVAWDERYSSKEAERVLLGAGRRREQRRVERDRVAAAIILQGWLDAGH